MAGSGGNDAQAEANKERLKRPCVCVTTFNMIAHKGRRSEYGEQVGRAAQRSRLPLCGQQRLRPVQRPACVRVARCTVAPAALPVSHILHDAAVTLSHTCHTPQMMQLIQGQEWGLLLLDEVHVVPAQMFRKVSAWRRRRRRRHVHTHSAALRRRRRSRARSLAVLPLLVRTDAHCRARSPAC